MYAPFFKLKRDPFEVSPDPHFFVPTKTHSEALAGLYYGIIAHKGFMVLTGEVGTGKTLVVRCLLDLLDQKQLAYAYICCSRISSIEFMSCVAGDLGIKVSATSKAELFKSLQEFLLSRGRQGLYTALIVDEAQHLSADVLEDVRLLTNLETARGKLLQIALIGQPELDVTLDSHNLRQLKQRIALRFHLPALSDAQTRGYIWDRLHLAGSDGPIFSPSAIARIFIYSKGLPRLINTISDNALISAFASGVTQVTDAMIDEVAADLRLAKGLNQEVGAPQPRPEARGVPLKNQSPGFSKNQEAPAALKSVGMKI